MATGKITKKKSGYTIVPNGYLRSKDISWKAKGLMTYLLSMAENWDVYKSDLANRSKDGYQSMLSAWVELENAGYIETIRLKTGNLFSGYDYIIHEEPVVAVSVNTNDRDHEDHQLISNSSKKLTSKILKNNTDSEESVKKPLTLRQLVIEHWLKVVHVGWTFTAMHGKKTDSIITKLKALLKNNNSGAEISDEKVLDLFKSLCANLPEYYKDKDLAMIDSKFNEITTEIINKKNGTKPNNTAAKPIEKYSPFKNRTANM